MKTRILLVAVLLAALPAGAADGNEPPLWPLFRFVLSDDGEVLAEYVGHENSPWAAGFRHLSEAAGAMRVPCETSWSTGIVIDSTGHKANRYYGAMTKYWFEWTHSQFPGVNVRYMRYKANAPDEQAPVKPSARPIR